MRLYDVKHYLEIDFLLPIQDYLCNYLKLGMRCLTLVARNPEDDEMHIILTNDDLDKVLMLLKKENLKNDI